MKDRRRGVKEVNGKGTCLRRKPEGDKMRDGRFYFSFLFSHLEFAVML